MGYLTSYFSTDKEFSILFQTKKYDQINPQTQFFRCEGLFPRITSRTSCVQSGDRNHSHSWDGENLFYKWGTNCGVGEDSWESLGLQGDPTSPS